MLWNKERRVSHKRGIIAALQKDYCSVVPFVCLCEPLFWRCISSHWTCPSFYVRWLKLKRNPQKLIQAIFICRMFSEDPMVRVFRNTYQLAFLWPAAKKTSFLTNLLRRNLRRSRISRCFYQSIVMGSLWNKYVKRNIFVSSFCALQCADATVPSAVSNKMCSVAFRVIYILSLIGFLASICPLFKFMYFCSRQKWARDNIVIVPSIQSTTPLARLSAAELPTRHRGECCSCWTVSSRGTCRVGALLSWIDNDRHWQETDTSFRKQNAKGKCQRTYAYPIDRYPV